MVEKKKFRAFKQRECGFSSLKDKGARPVFRSCFWPKIEIFSKFWRL